MKKLVVSLLAAGLVLPSAAALANNLEEGAVNTEAELTEVLAGPTKAELAEAEKEADKAFVEKAVAEVEASKDAGVKLEDGTRVYSPTGEVLVDKARTEVAKEEEAKKDAAVEKAVAKKVVKKAGKKALPKTSAVK